MLWVSLFFPFLVFAIPVQLDPGAFHLLDVLEEKLNDRKLAIELAHSLIMLGMNLVAKDSKDLHGSATASVIRAVDSDGKSEIFMGFNQGVRTDEFTKILSNFRALHDDQIRLGAHPLVNDAHRIANEKTTELLQKNDKLKKMLGQLEKGIKKNPTDFNLSNQYRKVLSQMNENLEEIESLKGASLRRTNLGACKQPGAAHLGACAEHEVFEQFHRYMQKSGLRITHSGAVQIRDGYVVTAPRCDSCKQFGVLENAITDNLPASYRLLKIDNHGLQKKDREALKKEVVRTGELFGAINPDKVDQIRAEFQKIALWELEKEDFELFARGDLKFAGPDGHVWTPAMKWRTRVRNPVRSSHRSARN